MFLRFSAVGVLFLFSITAFAQIGTGVVKGQVADDSGAVIPAAKVTATGPGGALKTATSGSDGTFSIAGLAPGTWTVVAAAPGLKQINPAKVEISNGSVQTINLTLSVVLEKQEVTVKENAGPTISTDPEKNAGAIILRGDDLQALSDDPDEMQDDLQALAGPSAGPDGGQIYIDGFTGGTLPPKNSIREIRINQNPFSSEYDKLGYGRIEILTKPGTDRWHGQAFYNMSDGVFDSRNPYSTTKPPFLLQQYGGNLSGSLSKKASIFFDFERRQINDSAVVNAITSLNSQLVPQTFYAVLPTPQRRTTFSPRLDYQLTPNNTLTVRYSYERNDLANNGVGQLNLQGLAYDSLETENTVRITDTIVLNAKTINETRFQYYHVTMGDTPANTGPVINVQGAFTDGGASIGKSNDVQNNYELQNYTSYVSGRHSIKYGLRLRGYTDSNISYANYNGMYTFGGIQTYQAMVALLNEGYTSEQIYSMCTNPNRLACPGPSQFTLTGGTPLATVGQVDAGLFIQDDWRWKPNFTLSLGLRYEIQNNISDYTNFAPRLGFAWAPGQSKATLRPKLVIRGGWGMFYTRFADQYTLDAERYNGVNQQQYLVAYPNFYCSNPSSACPTVPPISQLPPVTGQNTTTISPGLNAPYIMQSAIGIERQLPKNTTVSVNYVNAHGVHMLLSRDINAPLPSTYIPGVPGSGLFPYGGTGQIDQFESVGTFNQNQIMVNANTRLSANLFLFGNYSHNVARATADSASSLVSNPYNIGADYGASILNIHNRVFFGGSVNTKWNVRFSPFLIYQSSRPFNIIIPQDLIGDGILNQRPAYIGASGSQCESVGISTPYGCLNPNPLPGETVIARNLGNGPGFFSFNLRLSKTFGFGPETGGGSGMVPGGGGGGHDHGGGPFGGGGRGGMFGDAPTGRKYNITIGVQARNLFNNVNAGSPVGLLTSPIFGESNGLASGWGATNAINRRIDLQLRFSF